MKFHNFRPFLLLPAVLLLCCLSGCSLFALGFLNGITGGGSQSASTDASDLQAPASAGTKTESDVNLNSKFAWASVVTWSVYRYPHVQVIVEIRNTGDVPIYVSDASYELEDDDGRLVATEDSVSVYPKVLSPGDRAWLYDISSLDETPSGELHVVPHAKASVARVPVIRYNVIEAELKATSRGGLKVLGRLENDSANDEDLITVVAFLFNRSGYCTGILTDSVSASAGERVGFECTGTLPDSVTADTIDHISVAAYPFQIQF